MKAFIAAVAAEWSINLTRITSSLVSNCQRAGQQKVREVLNAYIEGNFRNQEIPAVLPKYTVENAMIIGAEAAEAAVRPWVLSSAHHTNPKRQEAGIKAVAVVAAKTKPEPVLPLDHHQEKTRAAVELADSEFEKAVISPLSTFLNMEGLRTLHIKDDRIKEPWLCLVASLTDESLASPPAMKAALTQGIVAQGITELHACQKYAQRNGLAWPAELDELLAKEA